MKNAYNLRSHLNLSLDNVSITRQEFERRFTKTAETVTFTFGGWDGKSYDGESRRARVLRCSVPGYEGIRFIKVGKSLHYIMEDEMRVEKATGESHPEASWLVDVERA